MGVVPFLTPEFDQVVPYLSVSLGLTMAMNVAYLSHDSVPFTTASGIAMSLANAVTTFQMLRVFPFDLNAPFELLARVVLVVALAGTVIGMVVATVKLLLGK